MNLSKLWLCIISLFAVALSATQRKTILISCDAFRWDYMKLYSQRAATPNLNFLIENGVFAARGIRNLFNTITLPSHVTLATGRYIDDHGMVSNNMFDPVLNENFIAWGPDDHGHEVAVDDGDFEKGTRWMNNAAEPIWVTVTRQNAGKSAVVQWPFASFKHNGMSADYYQVWNESVPYEQRIDQMLSQLIKPDFGLGITYFEELDNVGHEHGPNSAQVARALERIDAMVGYLFEQLRLFKLWPDSVDIVLTSDHGMTELTSDMGIEIGLYMDLTKVEVFDDSILPAPGYEEEVFQNFSQIPRVRAYKKWEQIPEILHFSHSPRIHEIVYLMDDGWYFIFDNDQQKADKRSNKKRRHRRRLRDDPLSVTMGEHGYDNRYADMWPTFMAVGPSFRRGILIDPFNNTQIYCLICALNDVKPHQLAECGGEQTEHVLRQTLIDYHTNKGNIVKIEEKMAVAIIAFLVVVLSY